jgi:hypothetical protein
MAVEIWNLMGGVIDYAALPILSEMKGVTNPEQLIYDLVIIRDHAQREAERQSKAR